jgi:GNAT superfamily N-acetyltransferase
MPTASVYPGGGTTYMPGGGTGTHTRGKRTEIAGWSPSSVRRLRNFLYSVQVDGLTGHGYAVTLTMRDTPRSADELAGVIKQLMDRYRRMGLVRLHWVMEWQGRGTPHLHMAVYVSQKLQRRGWELVEHWLDLAEPWGASWASQDVKPIESAAGWLQYLAKHGARSFKHYQRQGMPPGWTKTGRLWGHRGDWPVVSEPMRFDIDRPGWFRLRRMVRAWRLADARQEKDRETRARRIVSARRALSCSDPKLSQVRGTSEWVPEDVYLGFLGLLADQGHAVQQIS